ncbi:MAG TPA: MFS transporter [Holophagaceae bacterium]|jgi:MFS family permease|nr:MFS transporter [Holophagaceae bacterium]
MTQPRLGLRANAAQFSLLVLVNAFVGAMVGLERTLLPLMAEREFHLAARTAILSFIAAFGLSKAAANYFAGRWSLNGGRKRVLIWGWLAALPVPLILWLAPSWGWVVVANVFLGLNQGLAWSTCVIMKIDLAGPKRRGLAMGLNEFAGYGAVALAAWGSGLLAPFWGLRSTLVQLGLAVALSGLALSCFFVRETESHAVAEARGGTETLSAKEVFLRTSFRDRQLSTLSWVGMVNNLNDGVAWGLFPLIYATRGMDLAHIGLLAGLYPAVWAIAQLGTGWLSDHWGRKPLIAWGMTMQGLALAAIPWVSSLRGYAFANAALGLGTAMVYPALLAGVGDGAHPSWRPGAVGVYRLWRDAGYAVGALLAGVLADLLGLSPAIGAVAALTLGAGILAGFRLPAAGSRQSA